MSIAEPLSATLLDVRKIREDFPVLRERVHDRPLIYLDNAATSQKPQPVIDAMNRYYEAENSNIHRGVHFLSAQATLAYEQARSAVRRFIHARSDREIVFVRGTTEGINLVAQSYGRSFLREGDEIILSAMEHHSNIVPWQLLGDQTGAKLRILPMNQDGEIIVERLDGLLNERTRFVSLVHVSNSLGTINPVKQIIRKAHERGVPVLLDGAQAVPHMTVDVQDLDCDFYAFSGHKMFAPTGVGILYGKESLLDRMPPYQGGGDMIRSVTFEKTTYNELPHKFEAGTPNISGGIGLGAAVDYVERIGLKNIEAYERELMRYGTETLTRIEDLRLIGTAREKAAVLSFVLQGIHPHDVGTLLDLEGIAIRTGHHCTQPVMQFFGVAATSRASLAFYNTTEEIDALAEAIQKTLKVFH
jgi:cysteine desulfurase/selenocysteine lyase